MCKNGGVSCFGIFSVFVLAAFFGFSVWVLNKVEISSNVIAEPAVSSLDFSSVSSSANKKETNGRGWTKSFASSKVFYLVYVLGVMAILAAVSLAILKMAGSHCIAEAKIESAVGIWNDAKSRDWKEQVIEKNPEKTTKGNSSSAAVVEKCDERMVLSYGSFEKVAKHVADCIAEV